MNDGRYELIIYWSELDQAFIAEVPELRGCAADGATYPEAVAAVEPVTASGLRQQKNWAGRDRDLAEGSYARCK